MIVWALLSCSLDMFVDGDVLKYLAVGMWYFEKNSI